MKRDRYRNRQRCDVPKGPRVRGLRRTCSATAFGREQGGVAASHQQRWQLSLPSCGGSYIVVTKSRSPGQGSAAFDTAAQLVRSVTGSGIKGCSVAEVRLSTSQSELSNALTLPGRRKCAQFRRGALYLEQLPMRNRSGRGKDAPSWLWKMDPYWTYKRNREVPGPQVLRINDQREMNLKW